MSYALMCVRIALRWEGIACGCTDVGPLSNDDRLRYMLGHRQTAGMDSARGEGRQKRAGEVELCMCRGGKKGKGSGDKRRRL